MHKQDDLGRDSDPGGADDAHTDTTERRSATDAEELRERARTALQNAEFDLAARILDSNDPDRTKLVENLRIYQAELEIQNEELKRSERQAETALARFMAFFTNLPIAELVVDQNGLVVEANPEARSLLGLRDSRSHQYFLARLLHEEARGDVIRAWQQLEANQAADLLETRFQPANGATLIADLHIARLPADETQQPRFVCAIVDRTDAVRQREALRNAYDRLETSEERYRVLADFSPEWDYWLGANGDFIHVSPACLDTTGYSAMEFIDNPALLEQIIHADDLPGWQQHLLEPLASRTATTPLQFPHPNPRRTGALDRARLQTSHVRRRSQFGPPRRQSRRHRPPRGARRAAPQPGTAERHRAPGAYRRLGTRLAHQGPALEPGDPRTARGR